MEIIDLEVYCKEHIDKKIPKGKHYKIKVDREKYVVKVESLTGGQILELADKKPIERFQLNQKLQKGQVEIIEHDEVVDFTSPGIERFMTIPLDQTEG